MRGMVPSAWSRALGSAFLIALAGCSLSTETVEIAEPTPEERAALAADLLAADALDPPCTTAGHDDAQPRAKSVAQILLLPLAVDPGLGERRRTASVLEPAVIETLQRRGYDVLDHGYVDTELSNALQGLGDFAPEAPQTLLVHEVRDAVAGHLFAEFEVDAVLFVKLQTVGAALDPASATAAWCNVREPIEGPDLPCDATVGATCLEARLLALGADGIDFGHTLFEGRGGLALLLDEDGGAPVCPAPEPALGDEARVERAVETALAALLPSPCRPGGRGNSCMRR
jgi:hypothetical protein